jgi:hypothetical protein
MAGSNSGGRPKSATVRIANASGALPPASPPNTSHSTVSSYTSPAARTRRESGASTDAGAAADPLIPPPMPNA